MCKFESFVLYVSLLDSVTVALGHTRREFQRNMRGRQHFQTLQNADSFQQTLKRMQWWAEAGKPKEPTDKYVLFTPDQGGPNNIRIGWEMTGLVAMATNRTLVLPPAAPMYLLDFGPMSTHPGGDAWQYGATTTRVEDLINMDQLKAMLPTLTWEEFAERTNITSLAVAQREAETVPSESTCQWHAYEQIKSRLLFMSGDGPRREGFFCGEWWKRGGPREQMRAGMTDEQWALLTHGFVWHPDAFEIAAKVVNHLGIFNYNSIHARYNDFQYHEEQQTDSEILEKWGPLFKEGLKLYVASDQPEKVSTLRGLEGVQVVMLSDALNGLLKPLKGNYTEERWYKLLGPVEEIICTFSRVFVGTFRSSFSGHIHRMRLHAQAPVTQELSLKGDFDIDRIHAELAKWDGGIFIPKKRHVGDVFLSQQGAAALRSPDI